ncbi:MAG: histidinol-phosphate transaminase [Candidatus Planktophila sp.]|nr:histidinol-phosphate transaminase [Candidatus Planktophila sp.]
MMWPAWLPLRSDLKPLSPYGAPQLPAKASLNTNENPFAPSIALQQAVTAAVAEASSSLNRYPDRDATTVRTALASYINEENGTQFTISNIWAANGSNEIIQSLFLAFGSSSALGFTPSYSMHPLISKVSDTHWIDGKRNHDFSFNIDFAIHDVALNKPQLTFITTPNNPTGDAISFNDIEALAIVVGENGGILVVDEAYAEFSSERSAVNLIAQYPHVVVIRTMSKAFAFAGVRVGYLIADPAVINSMMLVRLPYHLSALTQAAATVALDFRTELLGNVGLLISAREELAASLQAMGLRTLPSSANFILFTGFAARSDQLWRQLLEKGVLIRDVGLSSYLRVTIGNDAENKAFIKALSELL